MKPKTFSDYVSNLIRGKTSCLTLQQTDRSNVAVLLPDTLLKILLLLRFLPSPADRHWYYPLEAIACVTLQVSSQVPNTLAS